MLIVFTLRNGYALCSIYQWSKYSGWHGLVSQRHIAMHILTCVMCRRVRCMWWQCIRKVCPAGGLCRQMFWCFFSHQANQHKTDNRAGCLFFFSSGSAFVLCYYLLSKISSCEGLGNAVKDYSCETLFVLRWTSEYKRMVLELNGPFGICLVYTPFVPLPLLCFNQHLSDKLR